MAVYTKVPENILRELLQSYALGQLLSHKEIVEGVENTNFLLQMESSRAILTLYEKRVREEELPFFIELMRHLANKGLPCPLPIHDTHGEILQRVCDRPAAIMSFLEGRPTENITPSHCRQVGVMLAHMHVAGEDFALKRTNDLSLSGWLKLSISCDKRADEVAPGLGRLVAQELEFLQSHWPQEGALPSGTIHADLFPDNVFFENDKLCGVIDFYFACTDRLAYDLAVAINAWCFDAKNAFDATRASSLLAGYESIRPLNVNEKNALPILLRGAALRFLLTRLYDWLHHPEGARVNRKDPLEYRAKLLFFRDNPPSLGAAAA
jgi:homoserine kinase type II